MTTTPSLSRVNTQASALFQTSVGIRVSKGRLSKAGSIDTAIVYVVEPLEESHAVDEVEASTAEGSKVAHNKVDGIGFTADRTVELSVTQSELGLEARAKHTARGQI